MNVNELADELECQTRLLPYSGREVSRIQEESAALLQSARLLREQAERIEELEQSKDSDYNEDAAIWKGTIEVRDETIAALEARVEELEPCSHCNGNGMLSGKAGNLNTKPCPVCGVVKRQTWRPQ